MRVGIDAMGADRSPAEEVKGALAARSLLGSGDKIVLIGEESAIVQQLAGSTDWQDYIEIRHTDQVIKMGDSPVEALRTKPRSSIAVMAQMHADGEVDACISAGNTGACVAAATMRLRRLHGVHRPGIAVVTPTPGGSVVICDVGANVNCRPQHLHQYGVMSSIYAQTICGLKSPRVALLSVGEEDAKGNDLVKKTRELLKGDRNINFIGNVEGRDLFRGVCDVMVCEGFVGNVILKLMEGMAEGVIKALIGEAATVSMDNVAVVKKAAKMLMNKWDFNEYGGAPLLGVDGICIICHGASDYRGIKNAVRVAKSLAAQQVNERITEMLGQNQEASS
jgi:glycerol-3-phosphate acyltransferase PlsX